MSDATRYAIYFAPEPSSPLWSFGSAVIGYDAATAHDVPYPEALMSRFPSWPDMTADPRRYGFHATLKAPLRLGEGVSEAELVASFHRFAASRRPLQLGGLAVTALGRFVALTPIGDVSELQALGSASVDAFEPHRAPLTPSEIARRVRSPLTERQYKYLGLYGYPYVHDEFRFHMTLTSALVGDVKQQALVELLALYRAHVPVGPVLIDQIALFRQVTPAGRFCIIARAALDHH
jgi:hypothetical protein